MTSYQDGILGISLMLCGVGSSIFAHIKFGEIAAMILLLATVILVAGYIKLLDYIRGNKK